MLMVSWVYKTYTIEMGVGFWPLKLITLHFQYFSQIFYILMITFGFDFFYEKVYVLYTC